MLWTLPVPIIINQIFLAYPNLVIKILLMSLLITVVREDAKII